ncbi:MAG: carbon storage regulator [Pirellulaceae bacterium]
MLMLSRRTSQSLHIGDDVTVHVVRFGRNRVQLGIEAPTDVQVRRSEIEPRKAATLPPVAAQEPEGRELFRVLLIDDGRAQVAYECESRSEANAWVEEWDREHLGLVAVVWPSWAPLDLAATIGGTAP